MAWNPWIRIEPADTPDGAVRALYDRTRDAAKGGAPDTVRLASLTPDVAGLLFDLQRAVEKAASGLTFREREIAALLVSTLNGCVH